jgi:hypothetical protein
VRGWRWESESGRTAWKVWRRAAGWNHAADQETGGWMGIRRLQVLGVGIGVQMENEHRGEVSGPRLGKRRQRRPI